MFSLHIFLIFSFPILTDSCINNDDIKIISSMIHYLDVDQYILVSQFCSSLIPRLKILLKKNVSGIYIKFEDLLNFLQNNKVLDRKLMIILKAGNEIELRKITKMLNISGEKMCKIFTWLMFLPKNHKSLTKNNFHVPFDCQFYIVDEFEIKEIYQIKRNSEMIYSYFGKYKNENLETNVSYLYENKMNMRGEALIMKINEKVKCRFTPECLHLEIWEDMGKILNFNTRFVTVSEVEKSSKYLLPDAHTNMTIIHHELQNGNTTFGPLTNNLVHLYIKEIDEGEEQWDSYLRPFDTQLWIILLVCISVCSAVISAIAWAAFAILDLQGFTLYDQALSPISAFCNQACEFLPNILSSRIARLSVYIASSVIVPAYSASLISFLTIHVPVIPFTDFESLAIKGNYKLAPLNNPFMVSFFTENKDPSIKKIIENQLVPLEMFPETHTEAIKLICTEDDVSIVNYNYRMFQFPATCSIIRVSDAVFEQFAGIELLNEGVHYRKLFLEMLVRVYTSGIMQKVQKINRGKTSIEEDFDIKPLSIIETKFVMVVFVVGVIITVFLFIGERLYCYMKSKETRTRKETSISILNQNLRRIRHHKLFHLS